LKDKIIESAVGLLNTQGINQTSFRDIAAALELSDGHVRYYFKTKEGLLLTIFEQLNSAIENAMSLPGHTQMDPIQFMQSKIESVFQIVVKYRFFFEESPKTLAQYPALVKAYATLIDKRKAMILGAFEGFVKLGLFKPTFTPEVREQTFYAIYIISDGWLRAHSVTQHKAPNHTTIKFHANLIMSLLRPYLRKKYSHHCFTNHII